MNKRNFYAKGSDVLTVIHEDCTGRKFDKQRANADDADAVSKIFKSVIDKYGLKLKIVNEEPENKLEWFSSDEEMKW